MTDVNLVSGASGFLEADFNQIKDIIQDGGVNAILTSINQTTTTGNALSVTRDLALASTDSSVVEITQDNAGDDQNALTIQQDSTSGGRALDVTGDNLRTQELVRFGDSGEAAIFCNAETASSQGSNWFYRDKTSDNTSSALVFIQQNNASDDQPALSIQQAGSGKGVTINSTGAATALDVRCTHADSRAAFFYKNTDAATYEVVSMQQDHLTGAIPVLTLRQDDVSEGFINFDGTDTGSVATSTGNSDASVTVEVNGTKYKMPLFAV